MLFSKSSEVILRLYCEKQTYWSVVLTRRHSYNNQSHTSLVLHERDWVFAWGDLIGWRLRWRLKSCVSTTLQTRPPSSVDADAPCECSVSQSVRTHTSHTGCVCALRSLGHGCVQEVKNYKYCSFSHTNRSFRVLGHQCVVTMGNCLIWISLCMFFFPLIETVTYTCHYMTDRLERFDLKTSKLDLLKNKFIHHYSFIHSIQKVGLPLCCLITKCLINGS